ncbi:hypothetical protein E2C01_020177 [Portunus trituberculatus]|uniref:Uncharacterized protein n=1 Tax=Portunus trituberculatus TaxID=210409 RepID=A0A5B7E0L8_PORTR|nr:hypothetical protein [Portunus trituberculatus]
MTVEGRQSRVWRLSNTTLNNSLPAQYPPLTPLPQVPHSIPSKASEACERLRSHIVSVACFDSVLSCLEHQWRRYRGSEVRAAGDAEEGNGEYSRPSLREGGMCSSSSSSRDREAAPPIHDSSPVHLLLALPVPLLASRQARCHASHRWTSHRITEEWRAGSAAPPPGRTRSEETMTVVGRIFSTSKEDDLAIFLPGGTPGSAGGGHQQLQYAPCRNSPAVKVFATKPVQTQA